jgi:N-acyl-D-amino-acid deacylase
VRFGREKHSAIILCTQTAMNAIREMTSLPADQLWLLNRGRISPGMSADLVLFDPDKVQDTATFEKPMSYATGVE